LAKKSSGKSPKRRAPDILGVTPERLAHGSVERLARPIADEYGAIARPSRAIDILAALERRGTITAGMRDAGEQFRIWFRMAHLDPLRAADLMRGPRAVRRNDGGIAPIEHARRRVAHAIAAVGSPGGVCLWHVVGLEESLKEWALQRGWAGRMVAQEAATGILIAALGALETYWRDSLRSGGAAARSLIAGEPGEM
jgi:hypothetical protein